MDIRQVDPNEVHKNWDQNLSQKVIFLEPHPHYPTHFSVSVMDEERKKLLIDIVGEYCAVPVFKLEELYSLAEANGFEHIWFIKNSSSLLDRFSSLNDEYPYELSFDLKKFQLQGFNYLKDQKSDIVNWSTGTGKTVMGICKAKYLLETGQVDKVVVASRNHNKINWQRQLKRVAGLDSMVVECVKGSTEKRREARTELYNTNRILIINYEKLRGDRQEICSALRNQHVYFIWDEMPTMLKNPSSLVYKGARAAVQSCRQTYQTMLSATPLENSPEDVYACVKLLDDSIFSNITNFRNRYGLRFSRFNRYKVDVWNRHALKELGMRISHITHQADKYKDPEIAAQFPKEHWEDVIIDLSEEDRKLYDYVLDTILNDIDDDKVLSSILMLQLICDNPDLINFSNGDFAAELRSKKVFTDNNSAKLQKLKDLLSEIDGKVVVFNMYNELGSERLYHYICNWGYNAVLYDGSASDKQKAEDAFRNDPSVKVFVSSDKGSDSINLEQGSSVINYNLPWKHTTLIQRVNRINRLTSNHDNIYYYNLLIADSIEDRKLEILEQKKQLQESIFTGTISDHADALEELSRKNLHYILTGSNS